MMLALDNNSPWSTRHTTKSLISSSLPTTTKSISLHFGIKLCCCGYRRLFGFGRHCPIDAASFFYRGDISEGPIGDKTTTGAYAARGTPTSASHSAIRLPRA
jgi:hypothetical protein